MCIYVEKYNNGAGPVQSGLSQNILFENITFLVSILFYFLFPRVDDPMCYNNTKQMNRMQMNRLKTCMLNTV